MKKSKGKKYKGTWKEDNIDTLPDDFFENAKPFSEVFPEMYASWKRTRGKQKLPTKKLVTLRLSSEVIEYFRASGRGWQTRLNQALLDSIHQ